MRVGFAAQTLTVPPGTPMGGYAFREGTATGTLDPLRVSAITWSDGVRRFGLALIDAICVNADLTQAARAAVSGVDLLWVAASHTHAGPETGCVPGGTATPPDWLATLSTAVADTIAAARRAETGASGLVHSGPLHGVGAVRSHYAGEPRVPLDVVEIVSEGRRAGVLVVLPVHPTVLPSENLLVSADLTGAVRRALADRLGPGTWIAVAAGAAGDISTRRTRQGQDASELDRLGALVADRCLELLDKAAAPAPETGSTDSSAPRVGWADGSAPGIGGASDGSAPGIGWASGGSAPGIGWAADGDLDWRSRRVTLEPKPPVDANALIAAAEDGIRAASDPIAARIAEGNLDGARMAAVVAPPEIEAEVAAVRIGDLLLAGLPGEPFLSAAEDLRLANRAREEQQGCPRAVVVLGYTNAYPGYLPPAAAYGSATYEVLASAAAPGSAELITRTVADLFAALTPPP
ncbi:hypothetical protein HDA40_000656 [Hamadaea flava]|uniref:Neutral/alkaline non-lysosomal ceramidase N-terminal domain-containing protein n=1 Tax=Hamadaea flava TaxID=1742688 RepID=A0ABV8M0I4_9ACTN|nr:hypothetical protein [Hamadaea flava]MCP2322149.1 hypothetical protein [Hamadaea flava]